jgi:hypothetical protein
MPKKAGLTRNARLYRLTSRKAICRWSAANRATAHRLPRVKLLPFVEQQVFLEKRKDLIIDTAVVAPGLVSPDAVVLFRLVGYSELVQLMSKGLVGVDVILVQVTRTPEALFCASDIEPSSLNAPRLGTRLFRSQSGYRIDPRRLAGRDIAGEQREYCEQRTNRGVCRAIQR